VISTGQATASAPTTPGVSSGSPVNKHQEQLRVEQLPVKTLHRQPSCTTLADDIQHRCGVLHYACLSLLNITGHLCPFAA